MFRPTAISLSPNTQIDDVFLALRILLNPFAWSNEKDTQLLEKDFEEYFDKKYLAISTNSGRSAQYLILRALDIKEGDEVIVQAFTCVAVPNSVIWTGAKPVYVDIDETFNINLTDLKKKITSRTKAIIVQHTFGIPANIEAIKKLGKGRNIVVIEDCCHAFGATYQGRKVGTLADIAFFSFGRDKAISSVFGGMILSSNRLLMSKVAQHRDRLDKPPTSWIIQQLFHPLAFQLILPIYNMGIGKIVLFVFQRLNFLSKAIYPQERYGQRPVFFPKKMPGGLAILARHQLRKLDSFTKHRKEIADFYIKRIKDVGFKCIDSKGASYLRFPLLVHKPDEFIRFTRNQKILLGDWYKTVVEPAANLELVYYKLGSCPEAERIAKNVINLPTYPALSLKEAEKIVDTLKLWKNIQ